MYSFFYNGVGLIGDVFLGGGIVLFDLWVYFNFSSVYGGEFFVEFC